MSNRLIRPFLNPIHFVDVNAVPLPNYQSKHRNDYLFYDTIKPWEQSVRYWQRWLTVDPITLQYTSNYQPITLKVFRCDQSEVYSVDFSQMQQDVDNPGFYIRQINQTLNVFPIGSYYLEVWSGSSSGVPAVKLRSEPFIIAAELPDTLCIEYSHFEKRGGVWFDSPITMTLRIPGTLRYDDTKSKDTIYPDQDENEEMLHSTPFVVTKLIVGGAAGIPPWLKDQLSRILGCSDVKIDGRYYTKAEGAEWEPNGIDRYPMRGWSIDLREKFNRDSDIIDNDVVLKGIAAAGLIVDPTGFGMDDNNNNTYIPIESLI